MTSVAGSRPNVVKTKRGASLSSMSQSTPSTVTHGKVEGPGRGIPQRSNTAVGEPQAAVDCASTRLRSSSSTVSGSRTIMFAHATELAISAGSSRTVGVQAASGITVARARHPVNTFFHTLNRLPWCHALHLDTIPDGF